MQRHDLFGADGSAAAEQLTESGNVPERRGEAAVRENGSGTVYPGVHVVGGELRPHEPRQQRRHAVGGGAFADPAEYIRLARAVLERAAVGASRFQHRKELVERRRYPIVDARNPAHGLIEVAHLGVRFQVFLGESDAGTHVEDVAHGGTRVTGVRKLRNVLGECGSRVQQTRWPTRFPATVPTIDLLTENSMCVRPGSRSPGYVLGAALPSWRTMNPSV